jgi:hypothetical protein
MELNTLKAFYDSIGKKPNEILLDNIKSHKEKVIILNLVQVKYNFDENSVTIVYPCEDKEFPDKKLSFGEFENMLKNEAGIYNFTSALLLCAIIDTEEGIKGSELKNIIAHTDHLNLVIMRFDEFNNSIGYLLQLGLVEEINKRFFVNKEWYNKKFRHRIKSFKDIMIKNLQKQLYLAERNHKLNKNAEINNLALKGRGMLFS